MNLKNTGDFTWMVPDCEELVWVTFTGDDGDAPAKSTSV